MNFRVELHPSVQDDLSEALKWYDEKVPGLGKRFINAVDERFHELSSHPERYPKQKGEFRQVSTKVFPYLIIYEILTKEKVVFISCVFHKRRNPKKKFSRRK